MNLSCCLYLKKEKSSLYFALFHQLCFLFIGILTQKFCRTYAQRSTKEIMTSPKTVIKSQSLLKDKCKFCFYHIAGKKVPEIIFKSQRLTRLKAHYQSEKLHTNFYFILLSSSRSHSRSHSRSGQAQAQGRVQLKVKVRTWSGQVRSGQVRSNSDSNSKVGPEL